LALVFGKYERIRRIAQGGMGEVFLARQTGVLDRLAILKSLRQDLAQEREFVDQFLDEARVAATLNHPNIVSIYDVGEWHGTYYIAMEYVPGEDLSKLWYAAAKAGVGLPFQVSVRICYEAALGLDHAHKAKDMRGHALNIVHRDVSPQNIMVRGDGVVKLVDFGIAKAANKSSRTQAGMVKGKLQYMSPEQVRGEALDGRSDQFSLGVVLWEMCTGRRLFKADTEVNTLHKILQSPIPKPSDHVPGFPAELEATIQRMLQRDADNRFRSLGEAAAELKVYLDRSALTGGETTVAGFVQQILGRELEERIADLTPMEPTEAGVPPPSPPSQPKAEGARAGATRLQSPAGGSASGARAAAGAAAPNDQPTLVVAEDQALGRPNGARGEQAVRRSDGLRMPFEDLSILHQWILDGVVGPEDSFTTDGRTFQRLRDAPQLSKYLEIAAASQALAAEAKKPAPRPGAPLHRPNDEPNDDPQTLALDSPAADRGADPQTGAFSLGDLPQSLTGTWGAPEIARAVNQAKAAQQAGKRDDAKELELVTPASLEAEAPTLEAQRQRAARVPTVVWMIGGIVVALALVVGALAGFAPEVLLRVLNKPTGAVEVVKAVEAARTDDPEPVDALLKALEPALAKDAATADQLAAAAILHIARARMDDQAARLAALLASLEEEVGGKAAAPRDPEAHRAAAYKLATRAATKDPAFAGALLARALYQAERAAQAELDTDAARLLLVAKDGPLELVAQQELETARALGRGQSQLESKDAVALGAAAEGLAAVDDARAGGLARLLRARAAAFATAEERGPAVERLGADFRALGEESAGDARVALLVALWKALDKRGPKQGPPAPPGQPATPPPQPTQATQPTQPRPTAAADAGPAAADAGPPPEPETYESALDKARRNQKAGRSRDASRFAKKALELKPGAIEAQLVLGFAQLDLDLHDSALRSFRAVLAKEPESCEAQIGVAEAVSGQGRTEDARREYQRYIDICPDGKDADAARGAIKRLE
jgi:tRNA A-37 threonylcarbamoyl transferase component Bud32